MQDEDFRDINLDNIGEAISPSELNQQARACSFKNRKRPLWLRLMIGLLIGLVAVIAVTYYLLLPGNQQEVIITVQSGSSLSQVIDQLANHGVVKSTHLTKVYLKLVNFSPTIQAGDYTVPANQPNIEAVFANLKKTTASVRRVTFYPGATLNHRNSKTDTTPSHREALKKVGYTDDQIDQAFDSYREHPLFKLLPEVDNLEGLIYGDTYEIFAKGNVEGALKRSLDQYLMIIDKYNLVELYKNQGLSLYQGIILASIVEREVNVLADRNKVAQVFLKRYRQNISLGSDVTYQYASRLAGKENDLYIKSPFNTRQVTGLPPTPIASPSQSSLLAVAHPAETNYLFFVAGDDDKTYFAETLDQHNVNVKKYCQKKCAVY